MGNFFSNFGAIAEIRLIDEFLDEAGFGFAIVQLKNGSIAETIILKNEKLGIHVILKDQNITDKCWINVLNTLSAEQIIMSPQPESPSNILNALNDDFLQKIFRYLPLDSFRDIIRLMEPNDMLKEILVFFRTGYNVTECGSIEISKSRRAFF